jgi:cardiolipin synthase
MLAAIGAARHSIELEMYIYADDATGREFLRALVSAAKRGVRLRVLADSFGSLTLPANYFASLQTAGGEVYFFNPLRFSRFGVRDHRKLLVCDGRSVFIGGANISDDYQGDGVTRGWFDLMIGMEDETLAARLTAEFDQMFAAADFQQRPLPRLRVLRHLRRRQTGETKVFAVRPGRGAGNFQIALQRDLAAAWNVDLMVPYFLPNRRLRKLLRQVVQRGGRVRLILPAQCDVPLARSAALVYYARLLRSGVEIYEYQPQILHAKLCLVDGVVYAGSSNLDVRSFMLNYEIMLRFTEASSLASAAEIFEAALQHSQRVERIGFHRSQGLWARWKNRWAHFLLARIDPLVALRQITPG